LSFTVVPRGRFDVDKGCAKRNWPSRILATKKVRQGMLSWL
jgi:hypothetical protein